MQIELDHPLAEQFLSRDVNKDIALNRSCRKFRDKTWVEPPQGFLRPLAVGLVPFVKDDDRREGPKRVAQRGLDLPPPKTALLFVGIQVWKAFQNGLLRLDIVLRWKEILKTPAVLENFQSFLCFTIR